MMMKIRIQQHGFTLVEVMIALVLASLVILAVVSLFLGNFRNYRMEEGNARIQENGRFALEILTENIRESGHSGCMNADKMRIKVIANAPVPEAFTGSDDMIKGFEAGVGLPATLYPTIVPNTDSLRVRRANGCGAALDGNSDTSSTMNIIANDCSLEVDDVVIVSDCEDAHIFRVSAVSAGSVTHEVSKNQTARLCRSYPDPITPAACAPGENKVYHKDAEIMKVESTIYYIRENSANIPSLYEYTRAAGAVELVEGVDDMQIMYGLDSAGADRIIDEYVTADLVTDWSQVVGAKLSLLLASIDDNVLDGIIPPTAFTKSEDGITVTAPVADLQLRRVFSTAVGMRNSVP